MRVFTHLCSGLFHSTTEEEESQRALEHLEQLIAFEGPATIAALILETIPGPAGIYVPPAGYMQGASGRGRHQGHDRGDRRIAGPGLHPAGADRRLAAAAP